ncbi:MAG: hypothetical protein KGI00_04450 [Candidatus Micrarchaeota archaeon]|nr:hypothetical protein [Candidatus Micrarchaeota archaeon]MDE1849950.1 hypothetical protein [Candidatus Micrarchaeota archaeon]
MNTRDYVGINDLNTFRYNEHVFRTQEQGSAALLAAMSPHSDFWHASETHALPALRNGCKTAGKATVVRIYVNPLPDILGKTAPK